MTCYKPLHGYFSRTKNPNGKREIVFNQKDGFIDRPVSVECGRCVGCRLEKSRQWAVRCVHEGQMHKEKCFLTLTYNDEHLPKDLSLEKEIIPKFMKRLRKKYPKKDIRYLYCGEYGEQTERPHYHICLFGIDFNFDREYYKTTSLGHKLYNSATLDKIWSQPLNDGDPPTNIGHAIIGDLTFESSAYVARYVTKKVNGEKAPERYGQKIDLETGELKLLREPEFARASKKPALGKRWFEQYYKDVYPNDFVVVNKQPQKPPKYYDDLLEKTDPELYSRVKYKRCQGMKEKVDKNPEEFTQWRLLTKEEIRERKKLRLPRSM
jgi:hypothetical protein